MNKLTLARPYAKAAFAYALDSNALETWQQFFNQLAQLMQHELAVDYLLNPTVSKQKKVDLTLALYQGSAEDVSVQSRFMRLLVDNSRLHLLREIACLYKAHYLAHKNQLEVKLYTPHALDESMQRTIADALAKRYKKTILVENIQDTSLISGVVIETPMERIDASLKGKIDAMLGSIQF